MNSLFPQIPAEYIVPFNINGLRGRMLRMPAKKSKKREILMVYGHHSSLERIYAFAEVLNDFGSVTVPDLPGFGGMDSFYKIGEKPNLDTMADYLASVIKLRYRGKRFTVAGISYGFTVVTRMLQRYPEIAKRVDAVISVVGFAHYEDFVFSPMRMRMYRLGSKVTSGRISSVLFRNIALHPAVLKSVYSKTHNAKHKFEDKTPEEVKALNEYEVYLWRVNDLRTHMYTSHSFLHLDNCKYRVDLPVWHISVKADNYFDNKVIEQHMKVIFTDFIECPANIKKHMPSVIAGKKDNAKLLPKQIRQLLNKKV
jgi:pimeloyl-ACP methyl ester carboxylesterase